MRGLLQAYTRAIVCLTTKECTAYLGDARCQKDLATLTVAGSVKSVADNRVIADAARRGRRLVQRRQAQLYQRRQRGPGDGSQAQCAGHAELQQAMVFPITAGNGYRGNPILT